MPEEHTQLLSRPQAEAAPWGDLAGCAPPGQAVLAPGHLGVFSQPPNTEQLSIAGQRSSVFDGAAALCLRQCPLSRLGLAGSAGSCAQSELGGLCRSPQPGTEPCPSRRASSRAPLSKGCLLLAPRFFCELDVGTA